MFFPPYVFSMNIVSLANSRSKSKTRNLGTLFLTSALSLGSLSGAEVAKDARPNILLITAEDMSPQLGCYGDPYINTPHIDRLAAEGMRFTRAYVTQAGCSPSRASILTGLYPHQNGQIGLATWGFRMFREDTPNVARSLQDAGYRTGIIGKLHINPESAFPFDTKEIPIGNFARNNLGDYARHAGEFFKAGSQPFFLMVNYPESHSPWVRQVDGMPVQPLEPDQVQSLPYFGIDTPQLRESVADYYSCISRLDILIGDLMKTLQESGQAENTLVFFLSDHGADFLRGKRTCYEGGVHVPLIARWPTRVKAGQVSDALVSIVDLMPTMLDVADAPPVPGLPGQSLLPILMSQKSAWRDHLFTEFHTHAAKSNFYPQRTVRNDRYKLIENLMPGEVNPGIDYVNKRFDSTTQALPSAPEPVQAAYRQMRNPPQFELYDLETDPYEFHNLAEDLAHAKTLTELRQQLDVWRKETADPLLNPEILRQLKEEVHSVITRSQAKRHPWGYPYYFFGIEPPVELQSSVKKKQDEED